MRRYNQPFLQAKKDREYQQKQLAYQQYDAWMRQNARRVMDAAQIRQCSDFSLVASPEYPGVKNLRVSAVAKINEPHYFVISAHIMSRLEPKDPRDYSVSSDFMKQQLVAGEQTLVFTLPTVRGNGTDLMVHVPGPYTIRIAINTIRVEGWGDFDFPDYQ